MEVHVSKYVQKFISKVDKPTAKRIKLALEGLSQNPPIGDIQPYKSQPKFYRLRIGNYRAIFTIESDIIKVTDIDSRGQIYK